MSVCTPPSKALYIDRESGGRGDIKFENFQNSVVPSTATADNTAAT